MFVILLRFSANKGEAGKFIVGHQQWIKRGFDDGVFLLVGSLKPNAGGFWRTISRCWICKTASATIHSSRKTSSARKSSRSHQRKRMGGWLFC